VRQRHQDAAWNDHFRGAISSFAPRGLPFSDEWRECLESHGVSALHMNDFAQSTGEFVLWKGDEPKRKRFLNGLLSAMERHADYVVACSVSMKDYKAVNRKYRLDEFMKPYTLVASNCAGSIIHWARGEPGNKLHPCTKFR
jgi:hypothetical protein